MLLKRDFKIFILSQFSFRSQRLERILVSEFKKKIMWSPLLRRHLFLTIFYGLYFFKCTELCCKQWVSSYAKNGACMGTYYLRTAQVFMHYTLVGPTVTRPVQDPLAVNTWTTDYISHLLLFILGVRSPSLATCWVLAEIQISDVQGSNLMVYNKVCLVRVFHISLLFTTLQLTIRFIFY